MPNVKHSALNTVAHARKILATAGMQDALVPISLSHQPQPRGWDTSASVQQKAAGCQLHTNTTSHTHIHDEDLPPKRSAAATCTVESQTGSIERAPVQIIREQSVLPGTQSTCDRGTACNLSNDASTTQSNLPGGIAQLASRPPASSSASTVFEVTPAQHVQPCQAPQASAACGTDTAAGNLQAVSCQQQVQAEPESKYVAACAISGSEDMQQLPPAQQIWSCPAVAQTGLHTTAQFPTQHTRESQEASTPRRRKSHKKPGSKRHSKAHSSAQVPDEGVCHEFEGLAYPTAAAAPQIHGCSTPAQSLPATTVRGDSPAYESEDAWQQHAVHASHSRTAQLPPRPEVGRKMAQGTLPPAPNQQPQPPHSHSHSVPSVRTPRLARCSSDRCVGDSESETGASDSSFVAGDGVQSEDSSCPSTLNAVPKRTRTKQKLKAAGASSSQGTARRKEKGTRRRRSTAGSQNKDDGHAAGINGHLSPLLDTSSTTSVQRAVTPDWHLRSTPASACSLHSCPACDRRVHGSGSRDRPQAGHPCLQSSRGSLRQLNSNSSDTAATHRVRGDCVMSVASKAQRGGTADGKRVMQQAYLAALSDSSARTPGYAKPTKAALLRHACGPT